MHAQQLYLNVCKTAILGYHGDKIISYKSAINIKYVKKSQVIQLSNMSKNHRFFKFHIWLEEFPEF
jgi:hypothetical protein